jgi:hypothetical protein
MQLEKAKEEIQHQIWIHDEWSHNVVSWILLVIDDEHSRTTANQLVREFELDKVFDIHEEADDESDC